GRDHARLGQEAAPDAATTTTTDNTQTTRLHITPLDPPLLQAILHRPPPPSASYHAIPTFPENNYGFVSLPTAEAHRIMSKLNGAILKGKKLKIHEARPDPRAEVDAPETADEKRERKKRRKEEKAAVAAAAAAEDKHSRKKRKANENVIDGYELPSNRHVKRGWTDPAPPRPRKDKDKRKDDKAEKKAKKYERSKYTESPECLFQTKLPPNKLSDAPELAQKIKKRKEKKKSDAIVVHEFENLVTHPTFIRSGNDAEESKLTGEFIEGKGWVDRSGEVKETGPDEKKLKPKEIKSEKLQKDYAKKMRREEKAKKKEKKEKKEKKKEKKQKKRQPTPPPEDDETSSSGSSSESDAAESESESESEMEVEAEAVSQEQSPEEQTKATTSPSEALAEVHPLEALFKKPTPTDKQSIFTADADKPSSQADTFTFFGNGADNDDIDEEMDDAPTEGPNTPYTQKQEDVARSIRSGAPTPDTEAIARFASYAQNNSNSSEYGENDEYDDDDDDNFGGWGGDEEVEKPAPVPGAGESDFAKWFWENRGDNNRTWKRRRREAAKEKRQRENRAKGLRGRY
ncbi:hypothetical protein KEM56_004019, partial [Ascosphaera pollenicola]